MKKDLLDYISRAYLIGKNEPEIKGALTDVGWSQDEVNEAWFEFIAKQKEAHKPDPDKDASTAKTSADTSLKAIFAQNKNYSKFFALVIIILMSMGFIYQLAKNLDSGPSFDGQPQAKIRYELTASRTSPAGVNLDTHFILRSSEEISREKIASILLFTPSMDYRIQDALPTGLPWKEYFKKILSYFKITASNAQENNSDSGLSYTYEIIPEKELDPGQLYKARIETGGEPQEKYGWAFQAFAPFAVISTLPRNQANDVPLNTRIEIVFNREKLSDPAAFFKISPQTEGELRLEGDKIIFLPKKLREKTVYRIEIGNGYTGQDQADMLGSAYVFSFETAADNPIKISYFEFANDLAEFIPDRQPALEIWGDNIDEKNLKAAVYRLADKEEFIRSYQDSRDWNLSWTNYHWQRGQGQIASTTGKKIIDFQPKLIYSEGQTFIELPQKLEKGFYLLELQDQKGKRFAWLQITPWAHYFSITREQSLLWLYDFPNRRPLAQADIKYRAPGQAAMDLTRTDEQGLLQFNTPAMLWPQSEDSKPHLLTVEKDQDAAVIKIMNGAGIEPGDRHWSYLSTDRYTYRMDDQINFWGIVKGRYQELSDKKVTVGLYGGFFNGRMEFSQEVPLAQTEVTLSSFHTLSGQLKIAGLNPGVYTLQVMADDSIVGSANIEILTYAKPAYQISLKTDKSEVFAGQRINVQVKANFFDGTPVADMLLEYSTWWNDRDVTGEIKLDRDGTGSFSYTPAYYESDSAYYPVSLNFTVRPKLAEEGDIFATADILIFGPELYLNAASEKIAGDKYVFTGRLNYIDLSVSGDQRSDWKNEYIGSPAGQYPLRAKIVKTTYIKKPNGEYYDPIEKIIKPIYSYDTQEDVVEEITGTTDQNGEWHLERTLANPRQESSYRIVFMAEDKNRKKTEASAYADPFSYNAWKDFSISLSLDEQDYQHAYHFGDKVNLHMDIVRGRLATDTPVLFYRYQNDINNKIIVNGRGWTDTFTSDLSPSAQYAAVVLGPYGFEESNSVTAMLDADDKKLDINIRPDKTSYRPQENIRLDLDVKDASQKGVKAELNISAVDEALFHILPYSWQQDILEGLYRNIYTSPLTGASQYAFLRSGGAEGGGCFTADTLIMMADKTFRPIGRIKVGDEVSTFADPNDLIVSKAVVQAVNTHYAEGYLLINGALKITAEHMIYINGNWQPAGNAKIGDWLTGSDGKPAIIRTMSIVTSPHTQVYNISVGKYHTYIASGYYVHNSEKGGSPRLDFVDTALYQNLPSSDTGSARVDFKAPDNLTSWRITALAFAPDTMSAGQSSVLVPVTLPFFVDATLSDYYTAGDQPWLRLRAFGDSYQKDQPVAWSAESAIFKYRQEAISTSSEQYFDLGTLAAGNYELEIRAAQNDKQDSLLKKITVADSFLYQATTSAYHLTDGLTGIRGNSEGITDLLFLDQGRSRFYHHLISLSAHESLRSDRQITAFFARQLLRAYYDGRERENELDISPFTADEGCLSLLPYSDSDLKLSAQMANLAPYYLPQEKCRQYFHRTLSDENADVHRIAAALYGLAGLEEPVLLKIYSVLDNRDLDAEDKLYLYLALEKLGDTSRARILAKSLIKAYGKTLDQEAWLEDNGIDAGNLNGLNVLLLSATGAESIDRYWNYITSALSWDDPIYLEKIMALRRIIPFLPADYNASFKMKLGSEEKDITIKNGSDVVISLSPEQVRQVEFSQVKGDIFMISSYQIPLRSADIDNSGRISITRQFLVNGKKTENFKDGDLINVRLDPQISSSSPDDHYQVIDLLPAGLRPLTAVYSPGLAADNKCDSLWYPVQVIGNKIYFNIFKGFSQTKECAHRTINYYARVINRGKFKAEPALVQSLSHPSVMNLSEAGHIEVK